jgi:predicted GH43/DUF377 family glycosyl hydrolase
MNDLRILTSDVLPPEWRNDLAVVPVTPAGEPNIFNPAITRHPSDNFVLAYRLVGADGCRRIGLCRLDGSLAPMTGSAVPFTDLVQIEGGAEYASQAGQWFADPRLIWWQDRLYLHWNSGSHRPANDQFLQQVDVQSLRPIGPAFTLERADGRRPIEKNWSLFEHDGVLHAFYSLCPAVVLSLSKVTPLSLVFSKAASTPWDSFAYTNRFGALRGGAPPLRVGHRLYIFFHSASRKILRFRYTAGLLVTNATPPFQPLFWTPAPIPLKNPFGQRFEKTPLNANVAEVIYPAGSVCDDGALIVSYGINDEHAAVARLDLAATEQRMIPVRLDVERRSGLAEWRTRLHGRAARSLLKLNIL